MPTTCKYKRLSKDDALYNSRQSSPGVQEFDDELSGKKMSLLKFAAVRHQEGAGLKPALLVFSRGNV
jgi:hypothetical protein